MFLSGAMSGQSPALLPTQLLKTVYTFNVKRDYFAAVRAKIPLKSLYQLYKFDKFYR